MADNNNLQLTNTFTGGLDTDTSDMFLKPDKYRYALNIRIVTNTGSNTGEARIIEGASEMPLTLNGSPFKLEDPATIFAFTTCDNHNIMFTKEYYTNEEISDMTVSYGGLIELFLFDEGGIYDFSVKINKRLTENIKIVLHVNGYIDGEYLDCYQSLTVSKNLNVGTQYTISTSSLTYPNLYISEVIDILTETDIKYKYDVLYYKKDTSGVDPYYTFRKQIKPPINNPDKSVPTWNIYKVIENNNKGELFKVFGPCTTPMWDDTKEEECYRLSFETFLDKQRKLYFADGHHLLMSVDINKYNGSDINNIQQYHYSGILKPVETKLNLTGGNIKSGIVQYSYQLYNIDGESTTISPLSNDVLIFDANINGGNNAKGLHLLNGNKNNTNTSASVNLTIPINTDEYEYIMIYRISYIQNGQAPLVDVIYDDKLSVNVNTNTFSYTDTGVSVTSYNIEYLQSKISNFSLIPKIICSKNNYLFAANVTSILDSLYSEWNVEENVEVEICEGDETLVKYNIHLFILSQSNPFEDGLYNAVSLRDGETYRYGIVLYREDGVISSAKWIADVTPKRTGYNSIFEVKKDKDTKKDRYIVAHPIGIKVKIKKLPEGCVGYEIVRCARTINDTRCITQGVVSNVLCTNPDQNKLTYARFSLNPFISMCHDRFGTYGGDKDLTINVYAYAKLDLLQFISPDVSYTGTQLIQLIKNNNCKLVPKRILHSVHELRGADNVYRATSFLPAGLLPSDANRKILFPYDLYSNSITYNYLFSWLSEVKKSDNIMKDESGYGPFYGVSYDATINGYNWKNDRDVLMLMNCTMQQFFINSSGKAERKDSSTLWHATMVPFDHTGNSSFANLGDAIDIDYIEMPDNYDLRELFEDNSTVARDSIHNISVGNYQYSPVILCGIDCVDNENKRYIDQIVLTNDNNREYLQWLGSYANTIGLGCPSLIIQPNMPNNSVLRAFYKDSHITENHPEVANTTFVCNIEKECTPYGGKHTRNTSMYLSRGNFFTADQKEVKVFDGDTYLQVYEHVNEHQFFNQKVAFVNKYLTYYHIPLETNINLALTYGTLVSKAMILNMPNYQYISLLPNTLTDSSGVTFSLSEPMYQYNTAYSSELTAIKYSGLDKRSSNYQYSNRIYYSNPKVENQPNDSFTEFLSANYLDVDNKYGEITDLINFRNTLYFWQESAFGQLSVNERQLLPSDNGTTLLLGTGDVLLRYDYISYIFGMKKDTFLKTSGQQLIYWYDQDRKSLISFDGSTLHNLNEEKLITNLVNNSDSMTDYPNIVYDLKYKEIIFNILLDKGALAYNELLGVFVSQYNVDPKFSTRINNNTYMTSERKMYKWNTSVGNNCTSFSRNGASVDLEPIIRFVVNSNPLYTKVFDNLYFDGTSDYKYWWNTLSFVFETKLNQKASILGNEAVSTREYDYKMAIPRNGDLEYGSRLRGKTMNCTVMWNIGSVGFALKYITTKYRISWN